MAARQRDRILAVGPDGDSLVKDPELTEFAGRVSDSGEGRWTIKAAIDEAVPAPVLTTALYQAFQFARRSRLPGQTAFGHAVPIRRAPGKTGQAMISVRKR